MATTLSGLENQAKVITMNALGKYDNLRPQVKPVKATYEEMTEMRDQGKFIPGQYYQITDYVTTVNEATITNARSAGHPFDLLVRADSANTLNEQAWAVKHEGDTYFNDVRLEAWQLKYRLDNVQWSKQAGTYVTDEDNGYTFLVVGDITLSGQAYKLLQGFGMYVEDWSDYALMETVAEGEQIICYYGDPEDFDPEEPEVVGTASGVEEVTESGKGTITWMKDEHGNECPYDFKNVQFKRYMTTDSVSGREGLDGKYMVADPDNCPNGLSVEDTEDFIWAYTFSSDNSGGEQTDSTLTANHQVHDNVMKANGSELNNITFFGNGCNNMSFGNYNYSMSFGNECNNMSFGNSNSDMSFGNRNYNMSFGNGCNSMSFGNGNYNMSFGNYNYSMSFGNDNYRMSFGNGCNSMSFGNECNNMSFGNYNYGMSFGNYNYDMSFGNRNNSMSFGNGCNSMSFGNGNYNMSFGNYNYDMSFGNECNNMSFGNRNYNMSFGNNNYRMSFGDSCKNGTITEGVQYVDIPANTWNFQLLNGLAGTGSSHLAPSFATQKAYTQVACKNSSGQLKIYVPGDLV